MLSVRRFLFGTQDPYISVYPYRLVKFRVGRRPFVFPILRVVQERSARVPSTPSKLSINNKVSVVFFDLVEVRCLKIDVRALRRKVIKGHRVTRFL